MPADTPPPDAIEALRQERAAAEGSWRGITEQQVRAKIRALDGHPFRMQLGRILAVALKRYAPKLLGLLPPEFLAANDDRSAA